MHFRRPLLGLLLVALLAGLSPGRSLRGAPRAVASQTPQTYVPLVRSWNDPAATAARVIVLVNQERARVGCPPLAHNAQLARAAELHSRDMYEREFVSHTNPDGQDVLARIRAQGYFSWTEGENLAVGQRSADEVMQHWLASPEHAQVLRTCAFEETGVGVVFEADDVGALRHNYYWTQIFAAPE